MRRFVKALERLFVLPLWACALIAAPAAAWLIWVFLTGRDETLCGYASFFFSAYALSACCASLPRAIHKWRQNGAVGRVMKTPFVEKMRSDALLRAKTALYSSLGINLLYAAVKMVSGLLYRSHWFGALAVYYLLLSLMRFALVRRGLRGMGDIASQWRIYRLCGAALLLMNQALAVVTALVVYRRGEFVYPGYLVYAMAAYTFYSVIMAAKSSFGTRRHESPVMTAVKTVQLVAALVSLFSLETAMLVEFGDPAEETFRHIMTAATGGAVCTIVLMMAVYMLVRGTKEIRMLKKAAG